MCAAAGHCNAATNIVDVTPLRADLDYDCAAASDLRSGISEHALRSQIAPCASVGRCQHCAQRAAFFIIGMGVRISIGSARAGTWRRVGTCRSTRTDVKARSINNTGLWLDGEWHGWSGQQRQVRPALTRSAAATAHSRSCPDCPVGDIWKRNGKEGQEGARADYPAKAERLRRDALKVDPCDAAKTRCSGNLHARIEFSL